MGKQANRYFSPELKLEVIERYAAGERPGVLAAAYAIRVTLVHQWVSIYRRHGAGGLRAAGRPNRAEIAAKLAGQGPPPEEPAPDSPAAQRRIALLEKKVAQQALELDFFKHALQHFEASPTASGGATAPTPPSGRRRGGKAG